MQAITVRNHASGLAGMSLSEMPFPRAAENDVVVRVHAAGFTPGELDLPATWTDRTGRARMSSVPGHELSGVVIHLGFGTAGLRIGQRVVGMADWARDGAMAEYVAVEARNLTALPADVDDVLAAAIPIAGLTAWQGLFDHGKLTAGRTVLIHGVAGAAASFAVQLARQTGAYVIGTGSAKDREPAAELGVDDFIDTEHDCLEDAGQIDLLFDTVGGEILLQRSAAQSGLAEHWSPMSARPMRVPWTAGRSSSSRNPTVIVSPISSSESVTVGSSTRSGPCARWQKPRPSSPPVPVRAARPSFARPPTPR